MENKQCVTETWRNISASRTSWRFYEYEHDRPSQVWKNLASVKAIRETHAKPRRKRSSHNSQCIGVKSTKPDHVARWMTPSGCRTRGKQTTWSCRNIVFFHVSQTGWYFLWSVERVSQVVVCTWFSRVFEQGPTHIAKLLILRRGLVPTVASISPGYLVIGANFFKPNETSSHLLYQI